MCGAHSVQELFKWEGMCRQGGDECVLYSQTSKYKWGRLNHAGCWQCLACVCLLYSELWLDEGSISVLELCSYLCFSSWGVPSIQTMPLATLLTCCWVPLKETTHRLVLCACTLLLSGSLTVPVTQRRVLTCLRRDRHLRSMLTFSLCSLCGSWPSGV